jgi:CCR4-NOT transcription complex subunit 2
VGAWAQAKIPSAIAPPSSSAFGAQGPGALASMNGGLVSVGTTSASSGAPGSNSSKAGSMGEAATGAPGTAAAVAAVDRYGLLALLNVIRMTDEDVTTLAIGADLTTLGLNLNSQEYVDLFLLLCHVVRARSPKGPAGLATGWGAHQRSLYATFASPWAEIAARRDPEFRLPACYYMPTSPNAAAKMHHFTDDTLFYIFYAFPRDTLQEMAALQLCGPHPQTDMRAHAHAHVHEHTSRETHREKE